MPKQQSHPPSRTRRALQSLKSLFRGRKNPDEYEKFPRHTQARTGLREETLTQSAKPNRESPASDETSVASAITTDLPQNTSPIKQTTSNSIALESSFKSTHSRGNPFSSLHQSIPPSPSSTEQDTTPVTQDINSSALFNTENKPSGSTRPILSIRKTTTRALSNTIRRRTSVSPLDSSDAHRDLTIPLRNLSDNSRSGSFPKHPYTRKSDELEQQRELERKKLAKRLRRLEEQRTKEKVLAHLAYIEQLEELERVQKIEKKRREEEQLRQQQIQNELARSLRLAGEKAIQYFHSHGLLSLWHLTDRRNISSILNNGILANQEASQFHPVDISEHTVQARRTRLEPVYNRRIHSYAPLFVVPRTPMLYLRRDLQADLCLIEVMLEVLQEHELLFTDGNAASNETQFFDSPEDLVKVPWNVLTARYWADLPDGKRKRSAEVLIYPKVEPKFIARIHCYSQVTLEELSDLPCEAVINRNVFF